MLEEMHRERDGGGDLLKKPAPGESLRRAEVFPEQGKNYIRFLRISLFFLLCGWDGRNVFRQTGRVHTQTRRAPFASSRDIAKRVLHLATQASTEQLCPAFALLGFLTFPSKHFATTPRQTLTSFFLWGHPSEKDLSCPRCLGTNMRQSYPGVRRRA